MEKGDMFPGISGWNFHQLLWRDYLIVLRSVYMAAPPTQTVYTTGSGNNVLQDLQFKTATGVMMLVKLLHSIFFFFFTTVCWPGSVGQLLNFPGTLVEIKTKVCL